MLNYKTTTKFVLPGEVSRPCNSPINEQHGSSDDDDELSLKAENIDVKQVGGVVG